jgi:hypothetical protein
MPNPVRPSLDPAGIWESLAALAEHPAAPDDARAALVSALALRHTDLPGARSRTVGARVLPFPARPPAGRPVGSGARRAAVLSLSRARDAGGRVPPSEAAPARPTDGLSVRLVPAPGAVPGLDEGPARVTVFRSLDGGRVLGREVPAGARVVVSRRDPRAGDIAVYSTRRAIGLCPLVAPPPGARILGVVEAVIA